MPARGLRRRGAAEHAELLSKTQTVFPEASKFECLPGSTLHGRLREMPEYGAFEFEATCKDGQHRVSKGCQNMDDCETSACGAHGKCVDIAVPTGEHLDDYRCDCECGFKNKTEDHMCENPPDCPKGACQPGTCADKLNDYECNCLADYSEELDAKEDLAHDCCMPAKCGVAPTWGWFFLFGMFPAHHFSGAPFFWFSGFPVIPALLVGRVAGGVVR